MLQFFYRQLAYYFCKKANLSIWDITILTENSLVIVKSWKIRANLYWKYNMWTAIWNKALSHEEVNLILNSK